ncbi:ATPase component of various ABC-type transport systems with duplicated ATPase domain [Corynebacterium kutscheri]|uniref:ATPase component of various ABC-type transport systems with duplicated ATPase domain n=1 Tax=Corynebacterium kutscheri TaxID=35755 RepID=A0A0F6R2L6_9CORY|nr:ABC transporter ATP-binding protein [Corynebacterium kutscheri]AKE41733.1 ATPase component of various ABC-type transport systems with duplicated ATPase domain [Corynebacterium kutscheri]VEH10060.1 Oligopeptide transport ATP-binding protein OppD [Corynebacterium kutscheri]
MTDNSTAALLELKNLTISFETTMGTVEAVRGVNLSIYPGQSVAIVGESGSGKSTLAMAIIGLLPATGTVTSGQILFEGEDLAQKSAQEMVKYRGVKIGLVPQDPMSNFNPVWRIGTQIKEALVANQVVPIAQLDSRVIELLEQAGLTDAQRRAQQYPHELSGGMRQRALIAMGLAAQPKLLIADEPTSALDVTVQKRILDHLATLTNESGSAVLFITHDLGLAAERAEHVVVMHQGRVVESGPSLEILRHPQHPYTQCLVKAAPSLKSTRIHAAPAQQSEMKKPSDTAIGNSAPVAQQVPDIIRVENLTKSFRVRGHRGKNAELKAVDNVSFSLKQGTTLAVVGESGSGKSTLATLILNLIASTSGKVYYKGIDVSTLDKKALFALRRKIQVVFQNPYGSLDPQYSIYRCIEEPLVVHKVGSKKQRQQRVAELLDMVALPRPIMHRFPHELSGGQRQRVALARALALNPEVVVLDEAVSSLDVLVQNQIVHLLVTLQAQLNLSYLFITHDLAVVRQVADHIVVMEKGKLIEQAPADEIFAHAQQEYTRQLIHSVPGAGLDLGG